jgi:hypothetical protein
VCFLGWFGVDYWYLGAPLTGLLKMFVNMFTFGYWWFYDILNVIFNRPTVELFGPTIPFYGSTGCAAGRFRQPNSNEDPERLAKHLNYIIYGVVLGFIGIIGGDSYLIGNTMNAFIRLICFISLIGIPIALVWWANNIFNYAFNANYFVNDAWYYLGAASPNGSTCPPSLLQQIFGPLGSMFSFIVSFFTGFKLPQPNPIDKWQQEILSKANLTPKDVSELNKAYQIKTVSQESQKGGANLQSETLNLNGTNTHLLSLLFAGTIGFIVVSSIILSLRRSYQNGSKKNTTTTSTVDEQRGDKGQDDVPPNPSISRVSPTHA